MLTSPWGTQTPPKGWQFHQSHMKWDMPAPVSQTLDSAAQLVLKVRLKNPAITAANKLSTNLDAIKDELIVFNALANHVPVGPVLPKSEPRRLLPQVVQDAAAAVKDVALDGANLLEWLADGQAVPAAQSAQRALVCSECPENDKQLAGRWYMVPVSEMLRKALEKRSDLKLSTPYDEKLGSCRACHCVLPLKVHPPIDRVMKRMTPEKISKLDPKCWILREMK